MPRFQFSLRSLLLVTLLLPSGALLWRGTSPLEKAALLRPGDQRQERTLVDLQFAAGNRVVGGWADSAHVWLPSGQLSFEARNCSKRGAGTPFT